MVEFDRQIEELVFNGGGARGNGLPGVYYALKNTKAYGKNTCIWQGIKTLAGTSVGSLTATLFAVGPELDELNEDILNQNIIKLLKIDEAILPVHLSLNPLKIFLNAYLVKHIKKHLRKEQNDTLSPSLRDLLDKLEQEDYQVTFCDLDLLHQKYPEKFKNLIITSTSSDKGNKILHLYNAKKTPHHSIAEACAASSALPFIFKPFQLNGIRHLDGGCGDPLPSEYFDQDSPERQAKRLLFVFGPGPSFLGNIWQRTLFGPPAPKIHFCTRKKEMEEAGQADLNESSIFIWLDAQSKQVHYRIFSSPEIQNFLSFKQLNISEDKVPTDLKGFTPYLINFYTQLTLRKHIPSILGNYSPIWILNYFAPIIKLMIGFPLHIATLFEALCQRLRAFYSFNTVVLYSPLVGNNFQEAENTKRTSVALYYLDTINHLTLYNFTQDHQNFYTSLCYDYLALYKTFLNAQGIKNDPYLKKYAKEKNPGLLYELIKEDVERNQKTSRAFALTCAVELHLKQKNQDEILSDINKKAVQECSKYNGIFYQNRYTAQTLIDYEDIESLRPFNFEYKPTTS